MSAIEDFRKVLQDFLAPELRGISAQLEALQKEQANARTDAHEMEGRLRTDAQSAEARLLKAIEQAKSEILLATQVATLLQQNAALVKQVETLQQKATPVVETRKSQ